MAWDEDRLHRWMGRELDGVKSGASLASGFGQDAAVLGRALSGRAVLCSDQCAEGVHFEVGTAAKPVGMKAVGRVLSDLAATGASARGVLLDVRASPSVAESWLRALIRGVRDRGRALGAPLVGGDLCMAPGPLSISIAALGEWLGRGRPPGRDRLKAGDVLVGTGKFGGSIRGRHLRIEPRLAEGWRLVEAGARAMIDVSDGLARDVARLGRASDLRVELHRVPVHRDARVLAGGTGRDPRDHALHDGEDHELVASLSPNRAWALLGRDSSLEFLGRVRIGRGLWVAEEDFEGDPRKSLGKGLLPWDGEGGWNHGV